MNETTKENTEKDRVICVYTDGSCSGNPGPMGVGIYLTFGKHRKRISKHIGDGTNNIAELTAILVGLENIKDSTKEIQIYTDSLYCIGIFTKNWKPKKNIELINEIKEKLKEFQNLTFNKVKGHSGNEGNEIADKLATNAVTHGRDISYYE